MKELSLKQMSSIKGGVSDAAIQCAFGLVGTGIGIAAVMSGAGTLAGLGVLASLAGTMPACDYAGLW